MPTDIIERLRTSLEHEHAKALGAHQATITSIKLHIPSLSQDDENEIMQRYWDQDGDVGCDVAALALRTCACGKKIDGFYEYVDHLVEVL